MLLKFLWLFIAAQVCFHEYRPDLQWLQSDSKHCSFYSTYTSRIFTFTFKMPFKYPHNQKVFTHVIMKKLNSLCLNFYFNQCRMQIILGSITNPKFVTLIQQWLSLNPSVVPSLPAQRHCMTANVVCAHSHCQSSPPQLGSPEDHCYRVQATDGSDLQNNLFTLV